MHVILNLKLFQSFCKTAPRFRSMFIGSRETDLTRTTSKHNYWTTRFYHVMQIKKIIGGLTGVSTAWHFELLSCRFVCQFGARNFGITHVYQLWCGRKRKRRSAVVSKTTATPIYKLSSPCFNKTPVQEKLNSLLFMRFSENQKGFSKTIGFLWKSQRKRYPQRIKMN